jgi:PAS domain S-box-containing protein
MYSRADFKEILNSVGLGVLATDLSGIIVYANAAVSSLTGLKTGSIAGVPVAKILPEIGHLVFECLGSGKTFSEFHVSEGEKAFSVNVHAITQGDGPEGVVCSMRPSELPVGELESYKNVNRQLKAIFESSSDGIWVCNGQGRVIAVNGASEKLNGVVAENIVGKQISEIMATNLFDRSVTLEVLDTGRQVSIIQQIRKTGKVLLVTGTPVFDEGGKISMVVVNERDITQLNLIREQLEYSRAVTEKYRDELAEISVLEGEKKEVIAENGMMRQVLSAALKLAHLDASNILLLGESGTGKGLLAKFIHRNGRRSKKPFIQINCAALPESLLEAELFGYEKGAFTGARTGGKAGLFELAQGGTLFLDEIGDLPLSLQAKLLKYLDDFLILRLGSLKPVKVDCTVIAATNQDLERLTKVGSFRQDLFYRLNTFTIRIPPLRERTEDIFELADHFLRKYNQTYHLKKKISPAALDFLQSYPFPGNVRELKSIIKRAVLLSKKDIMEESITGVPGIRRQRTTRDVDRPALPDAINVAEKELFEAAVSKCRTTRELARYLGISQPTVVRKLRKHGISRLDSSKHQNRS